MHRCEMEINGRLELPCGERAMFKVENHWYCSAHADAVAESQIRWSGINWFPLTYKAVEEPSDERHDYSNLFDDEDEE
jgi:hypothetical protein